MQGDEKMESAIVKEALTALAEVERELIAARDEAGQEALTQVSNNDSYRFLLGVSIGFDRALKILQGKTASLRPDTMTCTDRSTE